MFPWHIAFISIIRKLYCSANRSDIGKDPKFLERHVWANSEDPIRLLLKEQSDQGYKLFAIESASSYGETRLSKF